MAPKNKPFVVEVLRLVKYFGIEPDGVWCVWGRHKQQSDAEKAVASLSKKHDGVFEFRWREHVKVKQ